MKIRSIDIDANGLAMQALNLQCSFLQSSLLLFNIQVQLKNPCECASIVSQGTTNLSEGFSHCKAIMVAFVVENELHLCD